MPTVCLPLFFPARLHRGRPRLPLIHFLSTQLTLHTCHHRHHNTPSIPRYRHPLSIIMRYPDCQFSSRLPPRPPPPIPSLPDAPAFAFFACRLPRVLLAYVAIFHRFFFHFRLPFTSRAFACLFIDSPSLFHHLPAIYYATDFTRFSDCHADFTTYRRFVRSFIITTPHAYFFRLRLRHFVPPAHFIRRFTSRWSSPFHYHRPHLHRRLTPSIRPTFRRLPQLPILFMLLLLMPGSLARRRLITAFSSATPVLIRDS